MRPSYYVIALHRALSRISWIVLTGVFGAEANYRSSASRLRSMAEKYRQRSVSDYLEETERRCIAVSDLSNIQQAIWRDKH
jgi:hypothetical protein